ncbi:unnamed protein product [Symbiodinium natans]|uniref:Uncharacterized protein n=1 Tax=Symbiodinium natans TaxID=878477 RepID=A0A812M6R0_9DINO|nr:unnamed protein product [Symbiodinium natans]
MPANTSARWLVGLVYLFFLAVFLAAAAGYEGYFFLAERSIHENQVIGQCFDGRPGGESREDAKFTVRPSPWNMHPRRGDPPNPQLLCDIPVYAYECPAWASRRDCAQLHPEELQEVKLMRTQESGVFCFGSLGWFSWDQEACDADVWSCTFGPCNGYQKSARLCAAELSSGSYLCHFDPKAPGAGVSESSFAYPRWRGLVAGALAILALGTGVPACYLGFSSLWASLISSCPLPLYVIAALMASLGFGLFIQTAILVIMPGVTNRATLTDGVHILALQHPWRPGTSSCAGSHRGRIGRGMAVGEDGSFRLQPARSSCSC